ncbi:hypothetical protein CSC82_31755, partial [Rhodobacteraceae bacterium 4F10]
MKQRLNIQELEPNAYNAVLGIFKYLETSTLSKKSKNLIK